MVPSLVLMFALGLPMAGTTLAALATLISTRRAQVNATATEPVGPRLLILLMLPVTGVIFGLLIVIRATGSGDVPPSAMEDAAMAVGVPAFMADVGYAMVFSKGAPAMVVRPPVFSRVLLLGVLPATAAVFGLLVAIQILGRTMQGFSPLAPGASHTAALWISLGSSGAILGALASRRWDFAAQERWSRTLVAAVAAGDLPFFLGLAMAIATLGTR